MRTSQFVALGAAAIAIAAGAGFFLLSPKAPVEPKTLTAAEVFEQTHDSIVLIRASASEDMPIDTPESEQCKGRPLGGGTGFAIDGKGHILTNAHVVQPCPKSWPAMKLTVQLANGDMAPARLIGLDSQADLAVLKVDGKIGPALTFADTSKVRTGEEVIAIGYPAYLELGDEPTLSRGVVSAPSRSFVNIGGGVQTDAAVNHGNSGGPLLNLRAEVVGVNTIGFGRDKKIENINLAISAKVAQRIAQDLIAKGASQRADIGQMRTAAIDENGSLIMAETDRLMVSKGLLVLEIDPTSPIAGKLKACDLIKKIDGVAMRSVGDYSNAMLFGAKGKPMSIDYLRYPEEKCRRVPVCAGKSTVLAAWGTGCPLDLAANKSQMDSSLDGQQVSVSVDLGAASDAQRQIDAEAETILKAYAADGTPGSTVVTPR